MANGQQHTLDNARSVDARSSDVKRVADTSEVRRARTPEQRAILLPARIPASPSAVSAAKAPRATLPDSRGASSRLRTTR